MEPACVIERVSTGRQEPGLQSPEIAARVEARDYDVRRVFKLKASASKGAQQAVLDAVLEGARQGLWTVVVVVAIDRVERRGVFALRGWISDLHQAGARLESTSPGEEWLGDMKDELMWSIRLDMEADRARRESELRTERTRRGHARKDELGQGRVNLPLGWKYKAPKVKFQGEIVTDRPAQAAVKAAFRAIARGGTLKDGQAAMAEKGYKRSTEQVSSIIRNDSYSTGILFVPTEIEVKPVVSPATQAKARAVLKARVNYAGPRTMDTGAESFAGRIFCEPHGNPLHTWLGPPRKKTGERKKYYRPRGCNCGLFGQEAIDEAIQVMMATDGLREPETEYVAAGEATASRAARIDVEMARVFRAKPEGWIARLAELEANKAALEAIPAQRRETGRSVGQVWAASTRQEQRRYLAYQAENESFRVVIGKSRLPRGAVYWASLKRPD